MSDMADQISNMINSLGSQTQAQATPPQPGVQKPFLNPPVVDTVQQPGQQLAPGQNPDPGQITTLDGTEVDMAAINPDNLNPGSSTQQHSQQQQGQPTQQQQPQVDPALAALQQQIANQNNTIQLLMAQMQAGQNPQPQEPAVPQIQPLDPTAILKAEEAQGLVGDDGKLNVQKLLELFQLAGTRSYQLGREHTLRDVPAVVAPTLNRQAAIQASVSTFWSQNQDLQPFRQQLSAEANAISAQYPHYDLNTVLHQAASSVRGKLQAAGVASQRMQQMQTNPMQPQYTAPQQTQGFIPSGLAPTGQRPQGVQDNRSPMEKQLDDMLGAVG